MQLPFVSRKKYDEVVYKLECLLCQVTGSKLSKAGYDLRVMESWANAYLVECIDEALTEAEVTHRWVSVDERLPTDEEIRDEYGELVPFLVTEKDTRYPYRAFYDGTTWGDGLMKIKGITHWMPLPEAPKGE